MRFRDSGKPVWRRRQMAPYRSCERHWIEWLCDHPCGAKGFELFYFAGLCTSGHKNDWYVGRARVFAQTRKSSRAVHDGHHHVKKDKVRDFFGAAAKPSLPEEHPRNLASGSSPKRHGNNFADVRFIVDVKYVKTCHRETSFDAHEPRSAKRLCTVASRPSIDCRDLSRYDLNLCVPHI